MLAVIPRPSFIPSENATQRSSCSQEVLRTSWVRVMTVGEVVGDEGLRRVENSDNA